MTTVHPDAGIVWFAGMGFRPAVWTPPHRADGVDYPRLVPAPDADTPMLSKYDAPAFGYAWGTVLTSPPDGQGNHQQLLGKQALTTPYYGHAVTAPFPAGPLIPGSWHPPVDYPCQCVTPDFPPVAPVPLEASAVPLPASAGLLIAAVVGLFIIRRKS